MKIWKWTLQLIDLQTIKMPIGAKMLTVQIQYGNPQLWALCDPEEPTEGRHIAIYGTGNPVPDIVGQQYIATFQLCNGELIFHVFEITEDTNG